MKDEFIRYRLSKYRAITGFLQVAASTGFLAGFYFKSLTLVSSFGLAVLMLLGVGVRIKIRDPFIAILPALIFMCLNFYIFIMSLP